MQIDWFWLAVICGIGGLTIASVLNNYFHHKGKKYRCLKKQEQNKKEAEDKDPL